MTPKERARLRGLANGIETVLQIGKDGIGENLIRQADITLEARELIKGRVLDGCIDHTPRTAAEALAQATNSEVVQVIGSKFVLYRKKKAVEKERKAEKPRPNSRARRMEKRGAPDKSARKPIAASRPGERAHAGRKPVQASRPGERKAVALRRGASGKPPAQRSGVKRGQAAFGKPPARRNAANKRGAFGQSPARRNQLRDNRNRRKQAK